MRRLIPFILALTLVTSCTFMGVTMTVSTVTPQPEGTIDKVSPQSDPITTETPQPATVVATVTPTLNEEDVDTYNFLLLGGDYRSHRRGTEWGDKTDVMLLVSIRMEEQPKITTLQFNRNFYHPVEAMDDMWLFHVYGREGFEGLHYYFQQVFDVDLQGIAYINMDSFEVFIDALGGILLPTPDGGPNNMPYSVSSGADVLEYLRNNDNNWGCYSYYDCEQRQFFVLRQMAEKIKTKFHENALVTAGVLWDAYGELFQTDLSEFEQVHWLVELGWLIATSNYEIRDLAKMDQSEHFKYGETPLEVRGWTVREDHDATNWITENLGG